MNRREIIKMSGIAVAAISIAPAVVVMDGCDTSWVKTAIDDLPTIKAIINSILSIVSLGDPALTPAVSAAINLALAASNAALITLQALITDYNAAPSSSIIAKIDAALTDLQTNLSGVLAAAQIKNAALQATIATGIALAISVVSAISLLIPSSASSSKSTSLAVYTPKDKAVSAVPQKIKITDSATIKLLYNVVAASAGYTSQVVR
jgi:hypothetical protein